MSKTTLFLKKIRITSVAFLGLLLLSGCSYIQPYKAPTTQGNVMTAEAVQLLQEGLTQEQVRELLGPPMGANPFNPSVWEYTYYSTYASQQNLDRSKHLVLTFDQDKLLSSWQQVNHKVQLKKDDSWLGLGWF